MGRNKTLLGTVQMPLRIDKRVREGLKAMATEETKAAGKQVAMNTVASRLLADAVVRWKDRKR